MRRNIAGTTCDFTNMDVNKVELRLRIILNKS